MTFKFPDEQDGQSQDVINVEDDGKNTAAAAAKGADNDIELEIVDDTPAKDQGRPALDRNVDDPTEDELKAYSDNVQKRIKELTHARHDERRDKERIAREHAELERVTRALLEENQKLRGVVDSGSKEFIGQSMTLAEREVAEARAQLLVAQEAFDADGIAKAQKALMDAKIKLRDVKNLRPTTLQAEKPVVQTRQEEAQEDQIDQRTLDWQAKNQWFGRPGSEEYTSFALGLHKKLVASGYDPRSPAYFEQLNARMTKTFPELYQSDEKPREEASGSSKKPPASVVAPTTRSTGTRKVQLTATQVALASKLGLTPQQYAVELAKLDKEN